VFAAGSFAVHPPLLVQRTLLAKGAPEDARGFSERIVRRHLERHGWTVWRGAMLGAHERDDLYPVALRKYVLLHRLLAVEWPHRYDELRYLNAVHHGIPDFLCRRAVDGSVVWLFVEAKLRDEQLLASQRACIARLLSMGFLVEVHAVTTRASRRVRAYKDSLTGKCVIVERQLRLTKRLCESNRPRRRSGCGVDRNIQKP
jgi:hypothetical protein